MRIFCRILSLALIALLVSNARGEERPTTANKAPEYLFVQTARSGTLEGKKLTLNDVSDQTLFFTDRPDRMAGHISTRHFIDNWGTGSDSFKKDPPNATLSILGEKNMTNIVLELTKPKLKDNAVTYKVKVIEGTPVKEFGPCSLFFDLIMTGGGAGPTATPFRFKLEN